MSRKDKVADKVLLVEGRDDQEVIYQFCNHYGIDNQSLFHVENKHGVDRLIDDLRVRVRTGGNVKVLWKCKSIGCGY